MWLGLFGILIAIFVGIGGVLSGGIFTIILVPLAVIAIVGTVVYAMWGYAAGAGSQQEAESLGDPLPHSEHTNAAPRPNTPDELVNARQRQ